MSHKPDVKVVYGSVEYLYADIRANVTLDAQAVEIAVSPTNTPTNWVAAEWVGAVGKYRAARILLPGSLAKDTYFVYARVTDNPETPIIFAGRLIVE